MYYMFSVGKNAINYNHGFRYQPGTCFRKLVNLILEVDDNFLVFFAQEMCGLLTLEMNIFE